MANAVGQDAAGAGTHSRIKRFCSLARTRLLSWLYRYQIFEHDACAGLPVEVSDRSTPRLESLLKPPILTVSRSLSLVDLELPRTTAGRTLTNSSGKRKWMWQLLKEHVSCPGCLRVIINRTAACSSQHLGQSRPLLQDNDPTNDPSIDSDLLNGLAIAANNHLQPFTTNYPDGEAAYDCGIHLSLDWWLVAYEVFTFIYGILAVFVEFFHCKPT
eukprot:1143006-Pelagomonas_calceolata.AAC.2